MTGPAEQHREDYAPERLVTLDAIRGVAVIGILLMNITSFALPNGAYFNPDAWGPVSPANQSAFLINFILVDGKMRALFSILFGASMTLVVDRANRKEAGSGASVHYARMAVLFFFGLAHYYFIWAGDILVLYAVTGCIAWLFLNRSAEALLRLAILAFIAAFVVLALEAGTIQSFAAGAATDPDQAQALSEMYDTMGARNSASGAEEYAALRGSYSDTVAYRAGPELRWTPFILVRVNFLETFALMIFGAGLLRSGFFAGQWGYERYRQIALRYGGGALCALTLIGGYLWWQRFPVVASFTSFLAWSVPFDWMLSFAYAAVLVVLVTARPHQWLVKRFAAAGRAAFSNYLGTSLVMTMIFYGYGLGLFGALERWQLPLLVMAAAVVMLAWSKPWLDRFHYGPMEWLWRSLARGAWQPLRKKLPSNA